MQGQIRTGEIEGIRHFWSELEYPARVALVFRTGSADESLPIAGITHLIEHLTLTSLGHRPFSYNGFVSPLLTVFHAEGRVEDAVLFINTVCAALCTPALERIDHEKKVLLAEEAATQRGSWANHLSARYGATGPGIVDYLQLGLRTIDVDAVHAWAVERFNADNCALWTSFAPTPDLRPTLGAGAHRAAADPSPLPISFPNRVGSRAAGVGVTMTGERSYAWSTAGRILQRRLFERLRMSMAVAYNPTVWYERLGANTAHLLVRSDTRPEDAAQVADAMLDEIRQLREHGPRPDELADDLERIRLQRMDPMSAVAALNASCLTYMLGGGVEVDEDVYQGVAALTASDISAAMSDAWNTAMVFVPEPAIGEAGFVSPAQLWSSASVGGTRLARRAVLPNGAPAGSALSVSDEGVTLTVPPESRQITVWFNRLSALLWWHSGDRSLIGTDGFSIRLRAGEWERSEWLLSHLREHVSDDFWVPMDDEAVDPATASSSCEVCRLQPTDRVHARGLNRRGSGTQKITARMCRDCGLSTVRRLTTTSLRPRLNFVTLLLLGGIYAVMNIPTFVRLWRLRSPGRDATSIYWLPGKPVFLRSAPYLGLLEVVLVIAAYVGLAMYRPNFAGPASAPPEPSISLPSAFPGTRQSVPPEFTFPPGVPTP